MAVMLITHAMGVVAETAQRVVVMYAGKVVEEAPVDELFASPLPSVHAGPDPLDPADRHRGDAEEAARGDQGVVPSLLEPPPGCRFAPRCRSAPCDLHSGDAAAARGAARATRSRACSD